MNIDNMSTSDLIELRDCYKDVAISVARLAKALEIGDVWDGYAAVERNCLQAIILINDEIMRRSSIMAEIQEGVS